jgi:NADH dehydrogenase [ubiquinone] 1 alpha subcomplex assembly factor 7
MSLKDRLKADIAATGPMSVAQYMTACLHDPTDGYYATRPRLGADGDFITAPLVSQMFGELIGLWAAEVWAALGRPAAVRLVEVGPGDGTLISDVLRAARAAPDFLPAIELWLVEVSAPLQALQETRLARDAVERRWIGGLSELPPGPPVILIANEVLDCLPARQFVATERGWVERVVGLDDRGDLAFGLKGSGAVGSEPLSDRGSVREVSEAQEAFGFQVGEIVRRDRGAALLIDYGRAEPGYGDTLQALHRHRKVDPLVCPGEADLTVHADFPAVLAAAGDAGADTPPLLTQGDFLRRLGIARRADALSRSRPDAAGAISRQLDRLTGPGQMGELFKVAAVRWPAHLALPAFEEA